MYVLLGLNKSHDGEASVYLYGVYGEMFDARKEMKRVYKDLLEEERSYYEDAEGEIISSRATIYGQHTDMHLKILDDSDRSYEF